jgi:hypothetical protein
MYRIAITSHFGKITTSEEDTVFENIQSGRPGGLRSRAREESGSRRLLRGDDWGGLVRQGGVRKLNLLGRGWFVSAEGPQVRLTSFDRPDSSAQAECARSLFEVPYGVPPRWSICRHRRFFSVDVTRPV